MFANRKISANGRPEPASTKLDLYELNLVLVHWICHQHVGPCLLYAFQSICPPPESRIKFKVRNGEGE